MKKYSLICALLLISPALLSCSNDAGPDSANGTLYGATLASIEATSLSDLLADKDAYVGKTIQVSGIVVDVCAKRGCWINIGANDGESVRFKVEDGEMVFPMSAKGSSVTAQGVWTKTVVPIEELRNRRAADAVESGEEFDPASITEPYIGWKLQGLGAKITG